MSEQTLSHIKQIAIPVRDTARAVRFYRDTLGMKLLFEAPPALAFFDCGGVRLMLAPGEGEQRGSVIYYDVEGIETVHDELSAKGVSFVEAPRVIARVENRDVWLAVFRDSEENLVGLMEERGN